MIAKNKQTNGDFKKNKATHKYQKTTRNQKLLVLQYRERGNRKPDYH